MGRSVQEKSSPAVPETPKADRRVCVLTFHRIVDQCERDHDVFASDFRSLVELVGRTSRVATHLDASVLSERVCVLTFDDGTVDHMAAAEKLASLGLAGIFYIPTAKLGTPGYLARSDVRRLHEMGHAIGSHLVTHALATEMTPDQLVHEMIESKRTLEDLISERVVLFAPPGGVTTRSLPTVAAEQGFTSVRLMRWGIYRSPSQQWCIPCAPVTPFAIRRRWIERCVESHRLPIAMNASWFVKRALPKRAGFAIRRTLSRRASRTRVPG
jgi:hypothetical protein